MTREPQTPIKRRRQYQPRLEPLERRDVPSFATSLVFDAPGGGSTIASGDFNEDGRTDVAITSDKNLKVFLWQPGNTLGEKQVYQTGPESNGVIVGNVNNDNHADLVVANRGSGTVDAFLGNGDGTFQSRISSDAGFHAYAVALGDFDEDGVPDLAVANEAAGGFMSVLLGNGDGSFQNFVSYAVNGSSPESISVGDLNEDGHLDVAVAPNSGVAVLLGNGNGTFQSPTTYAIGAARDVKVTDVSGDAHLDLVATNTSTNAISVLRGNGDGTFQAPLTAALTGIPSSLAIGPLDTDANDDLAVAVYDGLATTYMNVFKGHGDGTFELIGSYVVDFLALSVTLGDLNADGRTDIFHVSVSGIGVLVGYGDGTFESPASYPAGADPSTSRAGDFDGDADLDLAVANDVNPDTITIMLNQGDASFQTFATIPTSGQVSDFQLIDADSDGRLDLVYSSQTTGIVTVLFGTGTGDFQQPQSYSAGPLPFSLVVRDFNGDDFEDVAVSSWAGTPAQLTILLNNGDGTFGAPQTYTGGFGGFNSLTAGDLDQDGDSDLARASFYGEAVSIFLNDGNGVFTFTTNYLVGDRPYEIAASDFNGDGFVDLATANDSFPHPSHMTVLLGNGDGTFQGPLLSPVNNQLSFLAVADFNDDAIPDAALVQHHGEGTAAVLLGNGDGYFSPKTLYDTTDLDTLTAGDFNGDGYADIITTSEDEGVVTVLLNNADWLPLTVTNTNDIGPGSLRNAILYANAHSDPDTITFAIGTGPQTIAPMSPLPAITDSVIIDGTTQPGFAGAPVVEIWGGGAGAGANGLTLAADNSIVKGLLVNFFDGNGIVITGNGNKVESSYIGVDFSGSFPVPNFENGVEISGSNNTIGGPGGAGNLIANNGERGVLVEGGTGNRIQQNSIHSNTGLGIELTNGGNNYQAKPSVNAATSGGGSTTITVSLVSTPSTTFTIEFFDNALCDPSTFGEGESFLGSKTLTTTVTGRGRTVFVVGIEVPIGHQVTATATSPADDTSEFSKCKTVTAGAAPGEGVRNDVFVASAANTSSSQPNASPTRHPRAHKPASDPTPSEPEAVLPTPSLRRIARFGALELGNTTSFDVFFSEPFASLAFFGLP